MCSMRVLLHGWRSVRSSDDAIFIPHRLGNKSYDDFVPQRIAHRANRVLEARRIASVPPAPSTCVFLGASKGRLRRLGSRLGCI